MKATTRKVNTQADNNKGIYELTPSAVPTSEQTKRTYKGSKIDEESAKASNPTSGAQVFKKMKRKGYSGGG
jgi:hypothetical protein